MPTAPIAMPRPVTSRSHAAPPSATSPTARNVVDRAGRGGEHLLGPPVVLLDAPVGHHRDREARDDDREHRHERGDQRLLERADATQPLDQVARARRVEHRLGAGHDRRHQRAEHGAGDASRPPARSRGRGGSAPARRPAAASRSPGRDARRSGPTRGRGARAGRGRHRRATTASARSSRSTHPRGSDQARSWVDQPERREPAQPRAPWCRRPPAGGRARATAPAAIAPQVRALADSWAATAAIPVPTRPRPSHEPANHSDPATGSPPAMSASGRGDRDQRGPRSPRRRTALSSGAAGSTARRAEQLGAAGLLLDAGVPAYERDAERHHEDAVGHGRLRHRHLAEAVDVEDRAVERDQRRAGVDRPGGRDLLGGRGVERAGRRGRGVAHHAEHGRPRPAPAPGCAVARTTSAARPRSSDRLPPAVGVEEELLERGRRAGEGADAGGR